MSFPFRVAHAVPTHPLGSLSYEYSGHINTLSIGASLRTGADPVPSSCTVGLSASANLGQAVRDPANPAITGIPLGSTILAAHLYWAGTYDPNPAPPVNGNTGLPTGRPGSTALVPDFNVLLNGIPVASSKNMTDTFTITNPFLVPNPYTFHFFGGYADVTAQVAATGNAVYTLSGLTVDTAGYDCEVSGVLAGWALHVVYSNPAEPFRVIKLYDGFQIYRNQNVIINPNGFTVPTIPKGKLVVTTWEGDEGNSTAGTLFSENLKINVLPNPVPTFALSGPLNPLVDPVTGLPNQFNGTRNTTNPTLPLVLGGVPAPYGVDIDHYDISAQLTPGQTSLTTEYSSGADLVILSSEMIVVENVPFADLAISKTHVGNFGVGLPNHYNITVSNVGVGTGLLDEPGPIVVTDTLPAGLNYVSASGTGWTCSYAGTLSCSHPGPLVKGSSLPPIDLTVTAPAVGTVTNTATVSGSLVDNLTLNNTASDVTTIINPPILTVLKSASATNANPGSTITYTVQVTNTGTGAATNVSQSDNLSKYTAFGVECVAPGVSIAYADGVPASTLIKGTPTFYKNGVPYVPPSLGSGVCTYDPNITSFTLPMTGSMPPTGTYSLQYKTQVK